MWLKKIINIIVSVSLIHSQINLGIIGVLYISTMVPTIQADAIVKTDTTTNSSENATIQNSSVDSEIVSDDATSLNAQCLIYYDALGSDRCKQYKQSIGSDDIDDLKSGGDPETFESCLRTNCGSYPTAGVKQEQTYPYIMETVKGCTLLSERTVNGEDLSVTKWLKNESFDENASISDTQSETKIIPYKLLQYTCPSYSEEVCISAERVSQSPVMCFRQGISNSLKEAIKNCVSGDLDACDDVTNSGGIGRFVFWQYCDADNDGDGYYESLSSEAQTACNRSDANLLRCEQDKACTLMATCSDEGNVTKITSEKRSCEDVGRHFEEHIINTLCGDQTDGYRENPDCVRINSITDALEDNSIKIGFASGAGEKTDDYTEFVIYRKKENFVHDTVLAALFFPWSLDKTKKGYSFLGIDVTNIAALFGAQIRWDDNGLETVLDDLYSKTKDYCNAEGNDCEIHHEQDVRSWSWKTGRIIKKKYTRVVVQSAIWTEPFIQNMSISGYEWLPGTGRRLKYIPARINYTMKANLNASDILVVYNTSTRPNYQSYIGTKINTYTDIPSCGISDAYPINEYKDLLKPVNVELSPEVEIHDVAMVLPHSGIYTINLYDNNRYVDSIVKYFPMNNGTNYPLSGADLLSNNLDYSSFSETVLANVHNKIPNLVQSQIDSKSTLIDNITNNLLRILIEANKYMLDNNSRIDYLDGLQNSDASLIYTLLEEDYFEELKTANSARLQTTDGGNFSNFPSKIDSRKILQFEEVSGADTLDPLTIQEQYATGRYGELTYQRSKPSFLSEINARLNNFITPLDDARLRKVIEYTNDVYSDYSEVKDKVNSYLNKPSNRFSTSTSYGSYSASFKSSCGDYNDALQNVNRYFDSTKSTIGGNYFQADLNTIKDATKSIISGHLSDQTIRYRYYTNKREGSSKYDNYHSAVAGRYSCSYDCNIWNSCATVTETVCDENGENCTGGECIGGYVWTANGCSESSRCYTYGSTGSRCSGQCNGYHVPYYGSRYDDSGDVPNDWDNSCRGSYNWYTTNDNYGTRQSATIDGVNRSGHFSSWGGYSCSNFNLSSTGNSNTKCIYNRHDQVDNYSNTIPSSTLSWSSISKKLNTSTGAVERELIEWMKNNNFLDSSEQSPYFGGVDNVRYGLAYNTTNGINTESNNYILPIIRTKVVDLYKNYLTAYYENLLRENRSQVNSELTDLINSEYVAYYNAYFENNWQKFNRIVIKDAEIRPENANSVNFDITLPGGHYVKNPHAFSITIAPHSEIRKYRCYTDWENCDIPSNCTFDQETMTNFITDSDGKSVATLKDIDYTCESQNSISTCRSMKIVKQCSDLNLSLGHIEYDDVDFSKEFYNGIGKALALNESIKIFGAEELSCEEGLFVDLSWAQDPMFWAGALMAGLSQLQGFSAFTEGMKGWASTAMSSLSIIGDVSSCAMAFGGCMSDVGFGPVGLVSNMFSTSMYNTDGFSTPINNPESGYTGASAVNGAQSTCAGSLMRDTSMDCAEFASEFMGQSAGIMSSMANSQAMTSIATSLGFASGASMMQTLGNPMVALAVQVIMNLAMNTFDSCSQCTSKSCAEAHEPKEATQLLAMDNALKTETLHTGSEYGLGSGFVAYNNCFFKKSGCAKKFIGSCIRRYKTFCCYNSQMARILAGQIYQQLGYTYENDGCSAIDINDLQNIDFSMCASGVVPSPTNRCINYKEIEDFMLSQVNWNTQKSFDVNTVIQASVNAAKNMD